MNFYTSEVDEGKPVRDYYVYYVDVKAPLVHVINRKAHLVRDEAKNDFLKVVDRFRLIKADDVENALDYKQVEGSKMGKVIVVPRSVKYEREDIETALNNAYNDYGYILDKMITNDEYVVLYLKEETIE